MRKKLFFSLVLIAVCFRQIIFAQTKEVKKVNTNYFDEKAACEQAKAKGIQASEINGYVQFLKNDFSSKKSLEKQAHKHTPYEGGSTNIQETIIYLEPNKPMSLGCPNMGFEQYNFNGWTGGTGTVTAGPVGGNPIYNPTGASIINAAGDNVSVLNTINYQTIMNIPPTSNVYPACTGFDSLAVRAIGSSTISDIPFVSPYSFDPISVRLNSANGNFSAARLKYITTTSSNNQRISFSYAVILNDPSSHTAEQSPYFKVQVKNESTGMLLPGCSSDDFNPKTATASDSLKTSVIQINNSIIKYRKWNYYSVDLSSLPAGTSVSINFEVGGCTVGSHAGYAYIDAECGGIGTPYANMCTGSTFATLVAPTGFISYQWFGPSGIIAGATNDTLIENPATVGNTYTVSMVSPGGCVITKTVSIGFTFVKASNLNSTSSCAGGNSGTASVLSTGSNGVYTYTWTNSSGLPVSNLQTATGLAPGFYGVLVSAAGCGQDGGTVSVGISPPFFFSQIKTFCGNAASIVQPNGSNYMWYRNATIIQAPVGTNDTLSINDAVTGDVYTVVYKNAQGCKDSLAYILNQIASDNVYFSNINNVCPGNNNGSALINLNPIYPPPYNYLVTGPNSQSIISNITINDTILTISALAPGTYTAVVTDGVCVYNNTVVIGAIQTNFTVTPTDTIYCFPEEVTVKLNIGEPKPTSCGTTTILCYGAPRQLFAAGTFTQNGATTYPTPYGNYYKHGRNQYLIKKSELNGAGIFAGKISSLAFNVLNMNGSVTKYRDFSIKMGCTNLPNLPNATTTPQSFINGFQTVYSNANQPISFGWITHNFSQAYIWDGNSNIVVEVCFSFPGTSNFSQNASIQLKQVPYIANMYHVEDAASVCGGTQMADNGTGSLMTNGENMLPNMRFGYCGAIQPVSSYTVGVSPNGTITANYTNDSIRVTPTFTSPPNGLVTYTISLTNPIGGCIATKTVAVFYPALSPTVTSSVSKDTICQGGNTTLTAFGSINYNWYHLQNGVLTPISNSSTVNVTPPSIGTNTYVVAGYAPCPSSVADTNKIIINVTQITNLIVTPIKDAIKCLNKFYVINTAVSSTIPGNLGTPYAYVWTTLPGNSSAPGINTNSSYIANNNLTTTLVVTVSGVCAYSTSDTVVVKNFVDDLAISIIDSSSTCANSAFTLNTLTAGGHPVYNYSWYMIPNTNAISNASNLAYTSPGSEGSYTVAVVVNDSCGYSKTDYEVIVVLPPCNVIIPNIITPNGDGANEFFKIKNSEHHPNISITIFDRWGIKVYENPNYNNEWKADGVSDGTFFYIVNVPDDKTYSGFVTVFKNK